MPPAKKKNSRSKHFPPPLNTFLYRGLVYPRPGKVEYRDVFEIDAPVLHRTDFEPIGGGLSVNCELRMKMSLPYWPINLSHYWFSLGDHYAAVRIPIDPMLFLISQPYYDHTSSPVSEKTQTWLDLLEYSRAYSHVNIVGPKYGDLIKNRMYITRVVEYFQSKQPEYIFSVKNLSTVW